MIVGNLRKGLTSVAFLRLRSPDIWFFQWGFPTAVAASILLLGLALGDWIRIDGFGIIESINSFIGVLVGFYIASLAAISSFPSKNLDILMKGASPELRVRRGKKAETEILTRRRFLAILFGFCSVISIAIYLCGIVRNGVVISEVAPDFVKSVNRILHWPFWIAYIWMLSSLVVTTLLALHYLVDRIHRQ